MISFFSTLTQDLRFFYSVFWSIADKSMSKIQSIFYPAILWRFVIGFIVFTDEVLLTRCKYKANINSYSRVCEISNRTFLFSFIRKKRGVQKNSPS